MVIKEEIAGAMRWQKIPTPGKMLNTFTICEKLTKIAVRAATNIGLTVGD